MLAIKPLKVLVCLAIVVAMTPMGSGWGYTGPDVTAPGLQGDALSAEPTIQPRSVIRQQFPGVTQTSPVTTSRGTTYSSRSNSRVAPTPAPVIASVPGGSVCGPQGCPPGVIAPQAGQQSMFPPMFGGMFSQSGFGLGGCDDAILPHVGCKQFQLSARLWYAKMNSSTQLWGGNGTGWMPGTELDLNRDLDLSRFQYIGEYEARCQIRPNWGIRFSFMPISYRDNSNPVYPFWWGNAPYSAVISTLTQWDRNIYRWDLVYDWFHQKHAVSSVFAGYALYDDKLTISNINFNWTRTRSRTLGLAYAGGIIERVIRKIGQATVSAECKGSIQFLEDYVGWDAQAVGRFYIPMNYGRWGYLEAGWRWIVLERSYPTDIDKTSLDGVTGAVGLIF